MTSNEILNLAADGERQIMNAADRLRHLATGASRLFQTGLANELEDIRSCLFDGRSHLRRAVDAMVDDSVKAAEQASVNQVSAALAVAEVISGQAQ